VPAHSFTPEAAAPLVHFANERHAIYMRKAILEDQATRGLAYPDLSNTGRLAWGKGGWTPERLTDDPILGRFRFCNVFRELDRVTVWIRENIREPFAGSDELWFMLAAARFINWPPTLQYLIEHARSAGTWPHSRSFSPDKMTSALEQWKRSGNKVETGAYMIRAESDPNKPWYSWSKQRYVAEIVLGRPWRDRAIAQRFFAQQRTLQETWEAMRGPADWVGWGPFMAGQVVADLRHTRYLRDAPDVGRWAPVGPGSARGLNRLAGRSLKKAVNQSQGVDEMLQLQELVNGATAAWVPPIELHDIQNCLCETDKYLRVQTGEGEPRASYVPGRGY
jgi:hypothetical protein